MTDTNTTSRTQNKSDRRNRIFTVGLAAVVATVGIGVPSALLSKNGSPESPARVTGVERVVEGAPASLTDIFPDQPGASNVDPTSQEDQLSPSVEDGPEQTGNDRSTDDPFSGMTEEDVAALSDDEFAALLEQAGWEDDKTDSLVDEAGPGQDEPAAADTTFQVSGDRIDTSNAPPEIARAAQTIWDRFVKLIPAEQRQMVAGFELMTEGADGAYVYASDQDPTKWILGVAQGLGEKLDYILIHEFGHLLTLQANEVPPGTAQVGCTTYFTGEGCALSSSTTARFVEAFWSQNMIDENQRIQQSGDWGATDAFYNEHRDEFVTDYAATNPAEDIAETFATFVTTDRPAGDTVAEQKILFFWNHPAMVALRDQIRSNMGAQTLAAA